MSASSTDARAVVDTAEGPPLGTPAIVMAEGSVSAAPAGAARPAAQAMGLSRQIAELKVQHAQMLEQKKRLAKDIRNAERKRKRIKDRARQLTDDDLVAVLMMRKEIKRAPDEQAPDSSAHPHSAEVAAAGAAAEAATEARSGHGDQSCE